MCEASRRRRRITAPGHVAGFEPDATSAYAQVLGGSGEAAPVGIVGERDQECGCLGRGGVLELVGERRAVTAVRQKRHRFVVVGGGPVDRGSAEIRPCQTTAIEDVVEQPAADEPLELVQVVKGLVEGELALLDFAAEVQDGVELWVLRRALGRVLRQPLEEKPQVRPAARLMPLARYRPLLGEARRALPRRRSPSVGKDPNEGIAQPHVRIDVRLGATGRRAPVLPAQHHDFPAADAKRDVQLLRNISNRLPLVLDAARRNDEDA
jgi:hypothetical protein